MTAVENVELIAYPLMTVWILHSYLPVVAIDTVTIVLPNLAIKNYLTGMYLNEKNVNAMKNFFGMFHAFPIFCLW